VRPIDVRPRRGLTPGPEDELRGTYNRKAIPLKFVVCHTWEAMDNVYNGIKGVLNSLPLSWFSDCFRSVYLILNLLQYRMYSFVINNIIIINDVIVE
jgi:hypothetical protein